MNQYFKACNVCDKAFVVPMEEADKSSVCPHCGHKNRRT